MRLQGFGIFFFLEIFVKKFSIYAIHICSTFAEKYSSNLLQSHSVYIDS